MARRALPLRLSKYVSPACRPSSLFAALLVKEHLRLNHCGLEDLLRISGQLRRLFAFLIGLRCSGSNEPLAWVAGGAM
ncbi:hypothetical protein TSH7_16275 [Azospirillum sp. TSH7]|uniref:hypothetical protein n=1 Tax=Azospirillum sp. TSA2s TaxID=709810 RepID=UPI000D615F6F|nr:hypothetical protein [Azospirillum sp. TSA2s]PWC56324.1 hypothetical protein TSH20_32530 [Azospirillum sp. TSH20]PWC61866.1 hypothetical protein TSH7_16275 [Azospirillum sp. TSH7]QCG94509.1 hypothetical protein E6C67_11345 [Azospirillum sp. TSA2s]